MSGLSDLWERIVLDLILGPTTHGSASSGFVPTTVYIGLFTTVPNDAGTGGVEVSGGSYARVAVPNSEAYWPAAITEAGLSSKKNANAVIFPRATANWAVAPTYIEGFGIFTASVSGQLMASTEISAPIEVPTNSIAVFDTGLIVVTAN